MRTDHTDPFLHRCPPGQRLPLSSGNGCCAPSQGAQTGFQTPSVLLGVMPVRPAAGSDRDSAPDSDFMRDGHPFPGVTYLVLSSGSTCPALAGVAVLLQVTLCSEDARDPCTQLKPVYWPRPVVCPQTDTQPSPRAAAHGRLGCSLFGLLGMAPPRPAEQVPVSPCALPMGTTCGLRGAPAP